MSSKSQQLHVSSRLNKAQVTDEEKLRLQKWVWILFLRVFTPVESSCACWNGTYPKELNFFVVRFILYTATPCYYTGHLSRLHCFRLVFFCSVSFFTVHCVLHPNCLRDCRQMPTVSVPHRCTVAKYSLWQNPRCRQNVLDSISRNCQLFVRKVHIIIIFFLCLGLKMF